MKQVTDVRQERVFARAETNTQQISHPGKKQAAERLPGLASLKPKENANLLWPGKGLPSPREPMHPSQYPGLWSQELLDVQLQEQEQLAE